MLIIVIGVLVIAIATLVIILNRIGKLIGRKTGQTVNLIILTVANCCGLLSLCIFAISRCKNSSWSSIDQGKSTGISFFHIKLFSLYLFALGYFFHCGLYAWQHSSSIPKNDLGVWYNIITIVYVFWLLVYFSLYQNTKFEKSIAINVFKLVICISIVCCWLDAFLSETSDIFYIEDDNDTLETKNLTRAEKATKETDPLFTPAMIEFSLMAINVLFFKEDDSSNEHHTKTTKTCTSFRLVFQFIIFMGVFALIAFTCTVLMSPSKDTLDDYLVYILFQLIIKGIFLIFICVCIFFIPWSCSFYINVSCFVMYVSCAGNAVYHVFYLYAYVSDSTPKDTITLGVSIAENTVSLANAGLQTIFIFMIDNPNRTTFSKCAYFRSSVKDNFVFYACSFLGMINLGLWISNSIGEMRHLEFCLPLCQAYGQFYCMILQKVILPLTIFFRFHTGLEFFKLYWEHCCQFEKHDKTKPNGSTDDSPPETISESCSNIDTHT